MAISPLDVVKIRLQVQPEPYTLKRIFTNHGRSNIKYSGIVQAFKTIVTEEGVRVSLLFSNRKIITHQIFFVQGLFKGNVAAEWLYVTYGASQFYAYYYLDSFFKTVSIKFAITQCPAPNLKVVNYSKLNLHRQSNHSYQECSLVVLRLQRLILLIYCVHDLQCKAPTK